MLKRKIRLCIVAAPHGSLAILVDETVPPETPRSRLGNRAPQRARAGQRPRQDSNLRPAD